MSRYNRGCRCAGCRHSYAQYRQRRRDHGKDQPRTKRTRDTDGHLPRDWFRIQIWYPALAHAGIARHIRVHDLRHTNASWMLAGGADLETVRERLGHASLRATERYLHTLPERGNIAITGLNTIRNTA